MGLDKYLINRLVYVLHCVILFLCFWVLLALRLPRLGKRELILVLFVRLFDVRLFGFVCFLFLLVSGTICSHFMQLKHLDFRTFESVSESVLCFWITDKTTSCSWYMKTSCNGLAYNVCKILVYNSNDSDSCLAVKKGSHLGFSSSISKVHFMTSLLPRSCCLMSVSMATLRWF